MEKKKNTTPKKKSTSSKKSTTKKVVTKKTSARKKKQSSKRAFTLIELLAVIIILGILMLVAIPSVTTYINNSRKSGYVYTANEAVTSIRNEINAGEILAYDMNTTYYFPVKAIKTENALKSPYGDFKEAYVLVTYDGEGYDYYFTAVDTANMGLYITYLQDLREDKIIPIKEISTNIAICDKEVISMYDVDSHTFVEKNSSSCIPGRTSADKDSITDFTIDTDLFKFDPTTGTILGFKDGVSKKDITIPESIEGVTVTKIGASAFHLEHINSVILPNSITRIENGAFFGNNLKKINLPSSLTYIGDRAFESNRLQKVIIPKNVTSIGSGAFDGNYLLYSVVNKTGRKFDFGGMFEEYVSNANFVSGTYKYKVTEEQFERNGYYLKYPYWIERKISTTDNLTINMDSIFDYGPYKFNVKSSNGYKIYSYNRATNNYEIINSGAMHYIDGYCGERLANFYITDSSGNVIFAGLYRFSMENAVC